MPDYRMTCHDDFDTRADIDLSMRDDIDTDDTLETAVIVSLFTDRRAHDDDDAQDKRGWWADNNLGSRLYLLEPGVMNQDTVNRAHDYCAEALQWMLDEQVVKTIDIHAGWVDYKGRILNPKTNDCRPDWLGIKIVLTGRDHRKEVYQYQNIWESNYAV